MYAKAEFLGNSESGKVEVGGVFSRNHELNIVETAEVIALNDDHAGVPHVRFSLISCIGPRVMDCGVKTLSVSAFLRAYDRCSGEDGKPATSADVQRPVSNVTHLKSHI